MRHPLQRLGTCAALAAALVLAPTVTAAADTPPPLPSPWPVPWPPVPDPLPGEPAGPGQAVPLPAFGDLLVDDAHQVLYVSGGKTANSVLVVGFDGQVRKTIDHQYGATGMVLSADGRTLYVALAAGDAVSAIDTTTLTETARYATTTAHTCPAHLARAGSLVWIGYGCGDAWNGGIADLDTSAPTPRIALEHQDQQHDAHYSSAPRLSAATPGNGVAATLAVSEPALSPVTLATYRIDGTKLQLLASAPRGGSNLNDLALASDGTTVYTAAGSQHEVDAFTTSDLSSTGAYNAGPSPTALALTPDGTRLTITTAQPGATVTTYTIGQSQPTTTGQLPDDQIPEAHGLATTTDGKTIFLISHHPQDTTPILTILHTETPA